MEAIPQPTVQVEFTLAVGGGRLNASLPVPAAEITLTQLLPVLQTLSTNIIGSAVGIVEREGNRISCRAGCGACCRQLVPLSIFEAEGLAQWVRSLSPVAQKTLEARFHAALLALSDQGLLTRMDPSASGCDEIALAIDYMACRVPCPFLVEESCSIHPIRPLICREYLVTSPPEHCVDPSSHPVAGVPIPLKLSTALFKLGAEMERDTRGWIPLVFLFAWMKSGLRPGDAIHGPGPQLLYEVVKRLAPV